jgi:hypothetical protein
MGMWEDEWKKQFKWFRDCNSIEEGKGLYRSLLITHHPDQGGDPNTCAEIVNEWEKFVKLMANRAFVQQRYGERAEKEDLGETQESKRFSQEFFQILERVMEMNVTVEIIGTWIWVRDTSPLDPISLEAMGFHFSKKHRAYWWNGMTREEVFKIIDRYRNRPVPNFTMDDLRQMWGNEQKREKMYMEDKNGKD